MHRTINAIINKKIATTVYKYEYLKINVLKGTL